MSYSFEGADFDDRQSRNPPPSLEGIVSKITSDPILAGAVASMGLALGLELAGRRRAARFVGLWAPTLLLIGLYRQGVGPTDDSRRQATDREERFTGGCASPPEETVDGTYRMTAAQEADDAARRSRTFPHKAK